MKAYFGPSLPHAVASQLTGVMPPALLPSGVAGGFGVREVRETLPKCGQRGDGAGCSGGAACSTARPFPSPAYQVSRYHPNPPPLQILLSRTVISDRFFGVKMVKYSR